MSTLVGLPATRLAALVRAGEVDPVDVVRAHLDRTAAVDPGVGAYRVVRRERALLEAAEVARRPDLDRLPLAGVPVAVKDNVPVAGEALRCGSAATADTPRPADHEVVRRLRAAGAVVVGLTAVPELCVFGTTDSVLGLTRNPWDRSRSPGGSSGGSAAAVASGQVPLAHGNDGMGSIRIPAACCGLVGVKPGSGTVPAAIGEGDWYGLAENGPLATTVADAALGLAVLAGLSAEPVRPVERPLRVALSLRAPVLGVRPQRHWADAARRTADALAAAGHRVEERDPGYATTAAVDAFAHWTAGTEADAAVLDRSRLERRVRVHAALGRAAVRTGLLRADARNRWRAVLARTFSGVDVLLTPALAGDPLPAVRWGERPWLSNVLANARYAPYASPWNLAGWPAATVPAGTGPGGRPVAAQLVTRPGGERLLLEVAALLEELRPWPRHPPGSVD